MELGVSGTAEVTYTTTNGSTANTGNPWGSNTSVSFSGSGELDNGWTVATGMTIVEDSSLSSSNVKLTMGGLGSLMVGNGTGGLGANFDNVLPTAYEEAHDGEKDSAAIDNIGNSSIKGVTSLLFKLIFFK